ncbi:hypothetical protein [Streptomyces sp. NPDC003697]
MSPRSPLTRPAVAAAGGGLVTAAVVTPAVADGGRDGTDTADATTASGASPGGCPI